MGAANKQALRVTFDRRLQLEFHGINVTSDAGLLAYCGGRLSGNLIENAIRPSAPGKKNFLYQLRLKSGRTEVGRVTPCAPSSNLSSSGAHGVARPTNDWRFYQSSRVVGIIHRSS